MKFRTEKECFHNGIHYNKGDIVECDCHFCKEKNVPYFKEINEEEENIPQETIKEEKINKAEESVKEIKKAILDGIKKEKEEVTEKKNVSQGTTPEKKIVDEVNDVIKEVEQELEQNKPKKRNKIEIV